MEWRGSALGKAAILAFLATTVQAGKTLDPGLSYGTWMIIGFFAIVVFLWLLCVAVSLLFGVTIAFQQVRQLTLFRIARWVYRLGKQVREPHRFMYTISCGWWPFFDRDADERREEEALVNEEKSAKHSDEESLRADAVEDLLMPIGTGGEHDHGPAMDAASAAGPSRTHTDDEDGHSTTATGSRRDPGSENDESHSAHPTPVEVH